jgi:hypothetical protein
MPAFRIAQQARRWESAVSVPVLDSAGAIRAALEELGWKFERRKTSRIYSKFTVVIMTPKAAHVFQFIVSEGRSFTIETWAADVSAGAMLTFLRIDDLRPDDEAKAREFLALYRKAVGKDPWRFGAAERSRAGYLLPEFRRAKKAWGEMGFPTRRRA